MILLQLFYAFVRIGLFAFGGGYATIPFMVNIVVDEMHWITYNEFLQVITISQMTPGPISVNAATYIGYQVAGIAGATVATIGFVLPPMLLVLIAIRILKRLETNPVITQIVRSLRPAVIALIAAAAYSVLSGGGINDLKGVIIAVVAFILLRTRKLDPVIILLLAGIAGVILYL